MNIKNLFIAGLFLSVFLISTYIIACRSDSTTKKSKPETVAAKPITGADQTEKYIPYLRGKRVGLVANPTSIIGKQASADSLLALGIKIQKVFGPEHGFRGNASNGAKVQDEIDAKTGLKIISLYGKTAKPTKEHLSDVDVMVFDIQDVGCRFYTIINTLEHVMEACAENNKELVILDRPNPNGYFVVVMQGRFHYYEGYTMEQVVFPVRVMKMLGIQKLFVSNAAGGLNPDFNTSDLMVITDHINLQPTNPLIGTNKDALGPRFPDMSEVYDAAMIQQARQIAIVNDLPVKTGVYVSVPGPMLETKAEYRYLSLIGADAVGMSTVPEIIAARHMELPCFAVSVITDMCVPGRIKKVILLDILEAAAQAEPSMTFLIKELIKLQGPPIEKEW